MPDSNKWTTKGKIFISNCLIKEAEIFQFSRRTLNSIWQWVCGRFAGFSSSCVTCGCQRGSVVFGEPNAENGARTKLGKCSKTINSPCCWHSFEWSGQQGETRGKWEKERKKLRRSTVYKAPSRSKKRKHSNSEADSDFYVEDEPKNQSNIIFKWRAFWRN